MNNNLSRIFRKYAYKQFKKNKTVIFELLHKRHVFNLQQKKVKIHLNIDLNIFSNLSEAPNVQKLNHELKIRIFKENFQKMWCDFYHFTIDLMEGEKGGA